MSYDAVVIGSGPNGLAAAITLARAGARVLVVEAKATPGGGMRTQEITLPGFRHDICAAIHPLGLASPFFRNLSLAGYGLEWILPPVSLAHPLDDGRAVAVTRGLDETAAGLGRDAAMWRRLFGPLTDHWQAAIDDLLAPFHIPRHPLLFGAYALPLAAPAALLAQTLFREDRARAVFAGMAGHSILPLEASPTAAVGLLLTMLAQSVGWPVAKGGSQAIADALVRYLQGLGGDVVCGWEVADLAELPRARAYLFDTAPKGLLQIAGDRLPAGYRRQLARFRYNPGVFKVDWALDGPIPWTAEACHHSATVHIGGTLQEIAAAERAVWRGEHAARPFVLLAQQSLFDATRAPAGKQTAWAYCHVPNGSTVDMTDAIERQVERFAPGFRVRILARSTRHAAAMEAYNPNYVGGDINGGVQDLLQHFTRPSLSLTPYRTPAKGIYICSSSTPPGGGVHGMCGYYAAQVVLREWEK
ncbi:MAG: NAD(P)/FAD-dependent oxidoreductase [Caldilinea sp.]|nr:NAD(P)/FAD-dependent oxidoreductase [Caldilinea sp.]MCB9115778.1 NAD(P)/FAD-dependent oxidoreductase [Caldilineaceae bacterium]MCB9120575.1 NAD(P)/FAD-dependent oxidoreductase [Caldilineaceae bacterium]MCO5212341.1 NAD(P)/FAD-dependent oxidoreductase [Caldilinea sp.]MCW5840259.1 NAD(P)/FAD-dependent oxidoreductase [Caldilinea sp.]